MSVYAHTSILKYASTDKIQSLDFFVIQFKSVNQ